MKMRTTSARFAREAMERLAENYLAMVEQQENPLPAKLKRFKPEISPMEMAYLNRSADATEMKGETK